MPIPDHVLARTANKVLTLLEYLQKDLKTTKECLAQQVDTTSKNPLSSVALKEIDVADYARRLEAFAQEASRIADILKHPA